MTGSLIIVSAPSGAGKTTLVGELAKRDDRVRPSVSYTSRSPRAGEESGVHYHFVALDEFKAMIERGEFLEWALVHSNLYGTSRRFVEQLRVAGFDVVLTIDVQGAAQARKQYHDAISVFVMPPSFQTLVDRLYARGVGASDEMSLRIRNAIDELAQYQSFDYVVINEDLDVAAAELAAIVLAERCRRERRVETAEQILQTLRG